MDVIEARLSALHLVRDALNAGDKLGDHLGHADTLAVWLMGGGVPASAAAAAKEQGQELVTLNFGQALSALKEGYRVARVGWNGAGMFAYLVPAARYPAQTGAAKATFGEKAMVPYRAYLALKTAQGDVATWSPSCSDVLADDWVVLDA